MIESITVDEKYTINFGTDSNSKYVFEALRYGEPWVKQLSLVKCSNLILAMANRILELEKHGKENILINSVGDLRVRASINHKEYFYDVPNVEEGKKLMDYLSNSDLNNDTLGVKCFEILVYDGCWVKYHK